jgi:hypothetical protein
MRPFVEHGPCRDNDRIQIWKPSHFIITDVTATEVGSGGTQQCGSLGGEETEYAILVSK